MGNLVQEVSKHFFWGVREEEGDNEGACCDALVRTHASLRSGQTAHLALPCKAPLTSPLPSAASDTVERTFSYTIAAPTLPSLLLYAVWSVAPFSVGHINIYGFFDFLHVGRHCNEIAFVCIFPLIL